jgi:hypothetical protein
VISTRSIACGKKVFHRFCANYETVHYLLTYLVLMPYVGVVVERPPPLAFFTMSIYTENGYANRKEYLKELADEYGKDLVYTLTSVLPASEDFDGLVTALEDAMDGY